MSSPRVVIGGSIVRNAAAVLREVVRAAVKGQREKKGAGVPEREVARFFPTAWKNQPPTSWVPWGQAAVAAAWKRRAAGCGGDEKRGTRRVTQGGLGGGWGRQPQKYTATTPRGSTAEAAIFHRRTETRPRELNTLSYFLRVEAALPPAEATAR